MFRRSILAFTSVLFFACGTDDFATPTDASTASDTTPLPEAGPEVPPPCDANEAPAANAVYVSKDGNDTSGSGMITAPYATPGRGILGAIQSGAKDVYLAEETYVEPTGLVLKETAAGIHVHGGWKKTGLTWSRDCAVGFRDRTVIRSETNFGVRVEYATVAAPVELDALTVTTKGQGASAADAPGESTYGVFVAANGALKLTAVHVIAGKGGNGGASTPQPAASGAIACDGLTACTGGVAGSPGGAGKDASTSGSYGADGFHPADGTAGQNGNNGSNGTPGGSGTPDSACMNNCAGQCQSSDSCVNGIAVGGAGNKGKCGCGGKSGDGGRAGHGGGASIGAWVGAGGKLVADYTRITASGGGAGSASGTPGDGAGGALGSAGAAVTCNTSCGRNGNVGLNCNCVFTQSKQLAGGATGGQGTNGGAGGAGGNGAGGDTVGYVTFGTGAVTPIDPARLVFAVGNAGASGGGGAVNGVRAESLAK